MLINDLEYLQTTMNWQFFAEGEMHIVEYPAQSRGGYSTMFTKPEAKSCVSIIS